MPLLLVFAFTLFTSATLLFLVQPMIGKTLLPLLGGTPAVWNTCMVFFQALLLAGYSYAHATTAIFGARRQALFHMVILLLPALSLGLTVDRTLLNYGEGSPIPNLLLVLTLSVGLPFFVVSTSAPLLQKWFAGTGHPAARDPYFLYGASNLGSMLALFGYPALVEPQLTLDQQRWGWRIGYGVLACLTALCAVRLWRSDDKAADWQADAAAPEEVGAVSWTRRIRWVLLAFVPSSLMLGATTYFTTDIAPIPLIWVLPLGLYLLSFILVFSRLPGWVHRAMVGILPFLILPLVFLMLSEYPLSISWKLLLHLAVLFVTAMVCHGELARDRPPTRHLTEFYLWMSFGGVLGGLFNALVAPVAFQSIVEYPLILVLACLLTPSLEEETPGRGLLRNVALMGFYFGAGAALLVPALARSDLALNALVEWGPRYFGDSGPWYVPAFTPSGLWVVVALEAAAVFACLTAPADPAGRAERWLDVGLPVALGLLAVGLNLGLRMSAVHQGIEEAINQWLPSWMAQLRDAQDRLPESVFVLLHRGLRMLDPRLGGPLLFLVFILPVVACAFFIGRPLRFGLGVGALLLGSAFCDLLSADILIRQRSFFGAFRVNDDGVFRRLEHGTTLHGQQRVRWNRSYANRRAVELLAASDPIGAAVRLAAAHDTLEHPGREPLTYFHRTGPIGQVFTAYASHLARRHVGLIGLGCGTLASYGRRGQHVTFYEIDPLVKHIAFDKDTAYFTFVQDARDRGVNMELVLGDARLKLEERAKDPGADKLGLLVCDAFSSDAIPVHLITLQALDIYLENLADDGLLAFHISNRYLDLEPVLANLAAERGLVGYIESDYEGGFPGKASSNWVVLARRQSVLQRLVSEEAWRQWNADRGWGAPETALLALAGLPDGEGAQSAAALFYAGLVERVRPNWWRPLRAKENVGVWSDDYSNLLRVFDWKY